MTGLTQMHAGERMRRVKSSIWLETSSKTKPGSGYRALIVKDFVRRTPLRVLGCRGLWMVHHG